MKKLSVVLSLLIQFCCTPTLLDQEIFEAVKKNDAALVRSLLEKRPELINVKDAEGYTPLHWAARATPANLELIKLLIDRGAAVNDADRYGLAPLHYAALKGHREVVELLIKQGADLYQSTFSGKTAFELASEIGQKELADVLIANGASKEPGTFGRYVGPYLGQRRPGMTPELFALGLISTIFMEHSPVEFSPDGHEVYWTSDLRDFGRQIGFIYFMKQDHGRWTSPGIVPFSGQFGDYNPVLSKDGGKIYFFSDRPVGNSQERRPHIWQSQRKGKGWSQPELVEIPDVSGYLMTQFSVTEDETIYFACDPKDSLGSWDIYRTRLIEGWYTKPENLGDSINGPGWDAYPFIAKDESYLLFTSSGRQEGFGGMDLYISFRQKDGTWTIAVNMGRGINSSGVDTLAAVSPDGKYLFFVSDRNGNVDVYWVDARVIKELRSKGLK